MTFTRTARHSFWALNFPKFDVRINCSIIARVTLKISNSIVDNSGACALGLKRVEYVPWHFHENNRSFVTRSQQHACAQCKPHRMLHQICATTWIARIFHHLRRKLVWSTGSAGGNSAESRSHQRRLEGSLEIAAESYQVTQLSHEIHENWCWNGETRG